MDNDTPAPSPEQPLSGLDDLVVTYDMRALVKDAESEFETVIASRELIDQSRINQFFPLEKPSDARN